ncbi:helix-turn-helix transcriptional regulator [Pseudomonas songnenensis]|uniref:helix-turn-helix transcriptional regulator n=1 Tax=Pseudomonas songnenensis TaxID=1176259 RepID=UPI0028A7C3FB|nr:WYL domain-containing protein [Pseudomonas songnenensis]
MEQLLRHELILGLLPSKDSALDSNAIHQRVANQGVQVDKRTIQRDLSELEQKFPHVHSRPKGKAKLWWAEKSLSRLSMLPTDAMNLVMIMDHAARFGMAAQVENLAPLRDYATSLLKGNRPSQNCVGKVISNTRFVVLESGLVKPEVLKVVQQALLDDASIEALYLKRGASEPRTLHIKPLGLSYQDSNIYLVCVFKGLPEGNLASLPLHRLLFAKATWENLKGPDDFNMNSFETRRSLISQKSERPVHLRLRISHTLYERLEENALTADQQLIPAAHGWWLMTGSLPLSQGLELWLLSQGEHLEVLEPLELRQQIASSARRMAALYEHS